MNLGTGFAAMYLSAAFACAAASAYCHTADGHVFLAHLKRPARCGLDLFLRIVTFLRKMLRSFKCARYDTPYSCFGAHAQASVFIKCRVCYPERGYYPDACKK